MSLSGHITAGYTYSQGTSPSHTHISGFYAHILPVQTPFFSSHIEVCTTATVQQILVATEWV